MQKRTMRTHWIGLGGLTLALASSGLAQRGQSPPILPDPKRTPGDALPVTKDDVCVPGYSKKVRDVPENVKKQVYQEYGIAHHAPGEYEVDHLISLELGGSNSIKNLWPQSYKTQPWNAHVKDRLENELHKEVCSGKIDLKTAQRDISKDWIAAYKRYFHTNGPLSKGSKGSAGDKSASTDTSVHIRSSSSASAHGKKGLVWVNLNSGVYWRPGTRYYGKTKEGKYMSEADALKAGYHAAKGQ